MADPSREMDRLRHPGRVDPVRDTTHDVGVWTIHQRRNEELAATALAHRRLARWRHLDPR